MGFDWKSLLNIGSTALNFIPGIGPVLGSAAKIALSIGGESGQKIKEGIDAISEGLEEVTKTPLTPEQQAALEEAKVEAEVALAEIAYKDKKLTYDDQAGGRDVIKKALSSDDPVVRQARPKMMVKLGYAAIIYSILMPILLILGAKWGIAAEIMTEFKTMIIYQGGTMWAAFMTSFTGYTVARSADKNIAAKAEAASKLGLPMGDVGKLLKTASKVGKMIS